MPKDSDDLRKSGRSSCCFEAIDLWSRSNGLRASVVPSKVNLLEAFVRPLLDLRRPLLDHRRPHGDRMQRDRWQRADRISKGPADGRAQREQQRRQRSTIEQHERVIIDDERRRNERLERLNLFERRNERSERRNERLNVFERNERSEQRQQQRIEQRNERHERRRLVVIHERRQRRNEQQRLGTDAARPFMTQWAGCSPPSILEILSGA